MDIWNLDQNFPNGYHEVKVGDIIILFASLGATTENNHFHFYEVVYKDKRYAKLRLNLVNCTFKRKRDYDESTCLKSLEKDWHWLVNYSGNCRWLRTPAQKALFGVKQSEF